VPLEPGWPAELDDAPPALRASSEPLPPGARARLGSKAFALFRPNVTDYQLAFTNDGRLFLTGGGFLSKQLGGATPPVLFKGSGPFSVSRDGKRVVHGCGEGTEIEDAATGRAITRLAVPKPKPKAPEPRSSVGGAVASLGHVRSVCAAFSPDGHHVVMTGRDGEDPAIYDAGTGARRRALSGASCNGTHLAWAGNHIACDAGLEIHLFDAASGAYVSALPGSESFAFDDDGTKVVTVRSGRATIRSIPDGKETASVATVPGRRAEVSALSHDAAWVAVGSAAGVRVFEVASGKMLPTPPGHGAAVRGVAIAPDGKSLVTSGDDGSILVWDIASRTVRRTVERRAGSAPLVAIAPEGSRLATVRTNERKTSSSLRIYDLTTYARAAGVDELVGEATSIRYAALERIGVGRARGSLVVEGGRVVELRGPKVGDLIALSPDGSRVFSGRGFGVGVYAPSDGHELRAPVFDLGTRQKNTARALDQAANPGAGRGGPTRDPFDAMAITPDGNHLVVVASDVLMLFEAASGRRLGCAPIRANAVAASDRRVVAALADGSLTVWGFDAFRPPDLATDCPNATPLATLRGHDREVTALAIAKDGSFFASASEDGTVLLWPMP
jgi:WD40 repeat protein